MTAINDIIKWLQKLDARLVDQETKEHGTWVFLTTPLTSTSWDGDGRSTTGKTSLDLSAVFGAPAGIKAVLFETAGYDSGSAGGDYWFVLSPNNTDTQGIHLRVSGLPNSSYHNTEMVVPCDSNGDVYYQVKASGLLTFHVWAEIWGYLI